MIIAIFDYTFYKKSNLTTALRVVVYTLYNSCDKKTNQKYYKKIITNY